MEDVAGVVLDTVSTSIVSTGGCVTAGASAVSFRESTSMRSFETCAGVAAGSVLSEAF